MNRDPQQAKNGVHAPSSPQSRAQEPEPDVMREPIHGLSHQVAWTPEQKKAFQHLQGDLLVWAGAGSGKTEVLAQRCAELVLHGTPVSRLLVVSFTLDSAGEMRRRIETKLRQQLTAMELNLGHFDPRVRRLRLEILELPGAWISTLHGFCSRLLRRVALSPTSEKGPEKSSWNPAFKILGPQESWFFRDRLWHRWLVQSRQGPHAPQLAELLEIFAHGRRATLCRQMLKLDELLSSLPDPQSWSNQVLQKSGPEARLAAAWLALTQDFSAAHQQAKLTRGFMDFHDLERLALEHLEDPAQRRQLQHQWDHLLVDECQDLSPRQAAILQALRDPERFAGSGNLFCVGDIRQAIYGFRLADPEFFRQEFARLTAIPGGIVTLQKSFRTEAGLLGQLNVIFQTLLPPALLGIDLVAPMEAARETLPPRPIALHLAQQEAPLIAQIVADLLARPGDSRGLKPGDICILMRSLAGRVNPVLEALAKQGIPARAETSAGLLESWEIRQLMALLTWLENPQHGQALAEVLLGPWGNMTPSDLAQIRLASPLPWPKAVSAMHQGQLGLRLEAWMAQAQRWRRYLLTTALPEALGRILEESQLLVRLSGLPGGLQRVANVEEFQRRAHQFMESGLGPASAFLTFLRRLQQEQLDLGQGQIPPESDATLRIMSIHRSKGLEFPVVLLTHLGQPFHQRDLSEALLVDRRAGLGLRYLDHRGRRHASELWKTVRQELAKERLSEEARLLYVAMTRARDRLILTGTLAEEKLLAWQQGKQLGPVSTEPARTALELLRPLLAEEKKQPPLLEVFLHSPGETPAELEKKAHSPLRSLAPLPEPLRPETLMELPHAQSILARLTAVYPHPSPMPAVASFHQWIDPEEEVAPLSRLAEPTPLWPLLREALHRIDPTGDLQEPIVSRLPAVSLEILKWFFEIPPGAYFRAVAQSRQGVETPGYPLELLRQTRWQIDAPLMWMPRGKKPQEHPHIRTRVDGLFESPAGITYFLLGRLPASQAYVAAISEALEEITSRRVIQAWTVGLESRTWR